MSEFKLRAVEIFTNNLKSKQPDISDVELESFKCAFLIGFNMGNVDRQPKELQDVALYQLSL